MKSAKFIINDNPLNLPTNKAMDKEARENMKMRLVSKNGVVEILVKDFQLKHADKITGYTPLESRYRAELCGQPMIKGFLGPMWDGDAIRYETSEVNDLMSI